MTKEDELPDRIGNQKKRAGAEAGKRFHDIYGSFRLHTGRITKK
jgi:hypothetical protein